MLRARCRQKGHSGPPGGTEVPSSASGSPRSIRVGGIQKLAGKTVTVTVHGAVVGRMRVSQYGTAHLYRRAGMPRHTGGDVVRVGTRAGTLVTYGTMRHRYHRMM